MIDFKEIPQVIGARVLDPRDNRVGKVEEVYVDGMGRPVWATVKTGLLGSTQSFVPLENASAEGDTLHVPFEKEYVKDAPAVYDASEISLADEEVLDDYYNIDFQPASDALQSETRLHKYVPGTE